MGFWNWIKKRRKKEENFRGEILPPLADSSTLQAADSRQDVQDYILDCCAQIAELGRDLKDDQEEYRIVTNYLNDMQVLENLPEKEMQEIRETAENIRNLNQERATYKNSEKRISDTQFVQMKREENQITDAIARLQKNEDYQNALKRDMSCLEGEKTEWHYTKSDLLREQKILRGLSFALPGILAASMAALLVLKIQFAADTSYAWAAILFFAAAGGFGIFLRTSSNQTKIKRSEININRAIVLSNQLKFKYVNVTNAVDYAREKYNVKNASELKYLWEQYLIEAKEREKYRQANEDLAYFNAKLVRLLRAYRLYDANVWVNQSGALLDKKEMVEVRHNLFVRRQKLRSRIEQNIGTIKERRKELDGILQKEQIDTPQIRGIIDSLDRIEME